MKLSNGTVLQTTFQIIDWLSYFFKLFLTFLFKDDEKRPDIICDISKKVINKPFMGFNRAQFSVIEASVLVSRLKMLPIEKILQEIEYLKIGIEKTAGQRESET